MKIKRLLIYLLILSMTIPVFGKLKPNATYQGQGNGFRWIFSGTSTQRDAVPSGVWTPTAGDGWWNTSTNTMTVYNGSTWAAFTGGGTTLDGAYDFGGAGSGRTIAATDGAVQITNTDNDSTSLLGLTYSGNSTGDGLTITMSVGSGDGIEFENTGSGSDIEGTGNTWSVSAAGAAIFSTLAPTGVTTFVTDVTFDCTTDAGKDIEWDDSRETLHFLDNAILGIGGATTEVADITFLHDGTDLLMEAATANDDWKIGATTNFDITIYGDSASDYVKWDTSEEDMSLNGFDFTVEDGDLIKFGDDDDFTATSGSTGVLTWATLLTDNTAAMNFGADQDGFDARLFGATTSTYAEWDASADELVFILADLKITEGSQIEFVNIGDGFTDWAIDISTDETLAFMPVETTHDQIFAIGDATYTADLALFGATSSTVTFDASGDEVIFDAYDISMQDADYIGFGDHDDWKIHSTTTKRLTFTPAGDETYAIDIGADTAGGDLKIFGATTNEFFEWDASLDYLHVVGDKTLFTQTSTTANAPFKVDATGTVAGFAIVFQTTDGGIQIHANGGTNGDITVDAAGVLTHISPSTLINNDASTNTTGIGTGTTTGTVTLGGTGTQAIDVGTGAGIKTVTVGSITTSSATTVQSGEGDLALTSLDDLAITSAGTLGVGANGVAQLITVGNETGVTALHLLAGTGDIDMQGVAASTITIGDAAQTAAITIGASTAAMTDLSLGTGVGDHTIHMGDGGTGDMIITIGSASGASSVSIKAGSGNMALDGDVATTYTIGNAAQTGAMKFGESSATGTVDIGTGAGARTVTVGSAAGASVTTVQSGTGNLSLTSTDDLAITASGDLNIGANAVEQLIEIGNVTTASSLDLKVGTGNFTLEGVAASTFTLGLAAQEGTMKFGNSSAASTVEVAVGAGVRTLNLATGGTGAKTINIGDGADTGTTLIKGGSGGVGINVSTNHPVSIGTGTTTGTVTIGGSATQAIDIGNGAGIKTVAVGSSTTSSTTTILGGSNGVNINVNALDDPTNINTGVNTGTVTIGGTGAQSIAIGDGGTGSKVITIGDAADAGSTTIKAGTGNMVLDGVAATTYTIGNAAQTGVISIGASTATMAGLNLGTGVGAHTIHIGDGGTAIQLVTVGSTSDASKVTIQGGTAGIAFSTTDEGVLFTTSTNKTHKFAYGGIGYVSATEISATGWANAGGFACIGLAAGVAESLAVEGYTMVDDLADMLYVTMPIPSTFIDAGAVGDLVLEFDVHEQGGVECNIGIRVFEYGNTTPIVDDQLVITDTDARQWEPLVTLSSGIGGVADIDADDILMIEITGIADEDDFDVYGVRLTYRVGIEATQ